MEFQEGKTYVLTKDVKNPHPDKRNKHDWRKFSLVKAGTRLVCRFSWIGSDMRERKVPRLFSGRYSHQDIGVGEDMWDEIVESLEPIDDFDALVREIDEKFSVSSAEILETLVGLGRVTFDEIRLFAKRIEDERPDA